ncbi:MAG: hypothetical protein J7L25_07570, partial [Deltaproteobacteria bacterium]|nr:hypothetical protein [Candidatus Tharpella aukensis]
MFRLELRLKTHISLIAVLLIILIIPSSVIAISDGVLIHSVHVLAHPGGYSIESINGAQGRVAAHGHKLGELGSGGKISNPDFQVAHKYWHKVSSNCLTNSSTPDIVVKVPKCPENINPAADIDAIGTVRKSGQKITLKKMKTVWNNYQTNLRNFCKSKGYKPPTGLLNSKVVDAMPNVKCTDPRDFTQINIEINKRGGSAYIRPDAVRAELKIALGKKLSLTEASAYQSEMMEKAEEQFRLAKKSSSIAEKQIYNSRAAKYFKRGRNACKNVKGEGQIHHATGIDAAIDEINLAGRGPQTRLAAIKIAGLEKQLLQKASIEFIESMMSAAKASGPGSTAAASAANNIALELQRLSPSEANVMINQLENRLGSKYAKDVVAKARKIRTAEPAAQKWMRRLGTAMLLKDGAERVYKVYYAKDEDKPQLALEEGCSFLYGSSSAAACGLLGAKIGTLFWPGPGTVVGGVVFAVAGYMGGSQVGYYMGSWNAKIYGVHQNAAELRASKMEATNTLYNSLLLKGIPQTEAEKAAKLFHSGKLKDFKQYMNNLRKKYIKTNISEVMDNEGFTPQEKLKFLNCLCEGCGTMSGYYSPEYKGTLGHGPCRCDGSYNTYKKPVRIDKKTVYACINNIIQARYDKSQANFDEMHKETEAAYKKMLETARRENAKSVQNELQEVGQLIQKDENLEKAAKLFNAIKELLLKEDRDTTGDDLKSKLAEKADAKVTVGDLDGAVKLAKMAAEVKDSDPEKDAAVAHLKKMRESWSNARSKLFPEIAKTIDNGNMTAAKSMLKNLAANMGKNNKYPHAVKDPKYVELKDKFKEKQTELEFVDVNKKYENGLITVHKKIAVFKGELTDSNQEDTHTINMPVNGTLNITLTIGPKLNFESVQLLDSDNKTYLGKALEQGKTSFSLLRAGTYHLKLTKDGRNFYYGPYSVEVSVDTQKFANDKENNNNFATANTLQINQPVTGHLGARGQMQDVDEVDYWKLIVPTDGRLYLYVTTSKKLNLRGGVFIYGSNKNGEYSRS